MYFVYILRSLRNNKTYVGSTSKEASKRLEEHNLGSNSWTRLNAPFKLIYYESIYCKQDALHREKFFKSGVGKSIKKTIVDSVGG